VIKSAFIAMTIIGCDCDAKLCEFIRDNPPEWTTMEECEAALKSRAIRNSDIDYPTVVAICSKLDRGEQPVMEATAEPVEASPEAAPARVAAASESGILARTAGGYRTVRHTLGRAAGGTVDLARDTAGWVAAKIPVGF